MAGKKYHPENIEKKWQQYWEENQTFKATIDTSKPKYYALTMFPYPSGAGLHVGHVVGYTGCDVIARYKRQKGFNVLHPMGWDSFGLPAERYAIRTGTHPAVTTERNINTYRRQLKDLGLSYDWSREFASSDPKYYKWTQWLFTKLYEKGLAYEAEVMVNYCPTLATVLANEEVENEKSVEGGYPIERRPLRQWILKITEYAQRLLDDLDDLEWPEYLKTLQKNWIGRSEGVNVDFKVADQPDKIITTYTTRHDTQFGVTFIALAPDHPLLRELITEGQKEQIENYIRESQSKSDLERTELAKEKSGVFTGTYVLNPINNEQVPVWVADYVLMSYGTGAVMGVPAHDERDAEFVDKYGMSKISTFDEDGQYINSTNENVDLSKASSIQEAKDLIADFLESTNQGKRKVNFKLRDWLFSRQRYWGEPVPILHLEDGTMRALEGDELPLTPPLLEDYKPSADGNSPLAKVRKWVEVIDPKTGKKALRETNTMPQWAGSCWYYLRFCDPHNEEMAWSEEAEKYWMPVDRYIGGVEHAVLHLLYARFWHKVFYDIGLVSTKEPFKKMSNQGLVTSKSYKKASGGYVYEKDVMIEEDGKIKLRNSDERITSLIEKMSKSKLNGVSPDEIIESYGADALRIYELFMTPFDKEKVWKSAAVSGSRRFLNRVYEMVTDDAKITDEEESGDAKKLINRLVKGVGEDLEKMSFNTAIAKMMEFINHFSSQKKYPKSALKKLVQLIYSFAPHFGEECWQLLGNKDETMTYIPFPEYDASCIQDEEVTIVIQVKGKLRGKGIFKRGVTKEEVLTFAKEDANVKKYLTGEILKEIFVPDKLLNLVVK